MRKWAVVGAVAVVVVAGVLGFALANVNRWLDRNRDWVAAQASAAVGREVAFDAVGVSLRGGVSARLTNLRVADDPRYAREPFLQAKEVRVALRILPALFRRIEVRYVVIDAPAVTVIRDARGLSVASLGGEKPAGERGSAPAAGGLPAGAAALLVSSIRIEDGRVRFVDRAATPPAEYVADHVDVRATDVSPTRATSFRASAAVLGATKQNVTVDGSVGPLGERDVPADVTIRLADVAPWAASGAIRLAARIAPARGGPPAVHGTATLHGLEAAVPGAPRVADVESTVELKGDSAVVQPTHFTLNGVPLEAEATVERFQPARVRFTVKCAACDVKRLGYGGEGVREDEILTDVVTTGSAEILPAGPEAHVSVRSPRGSLRDVPYEGLETDATLAGQVATVDRMHVAALGGTVEGSARVDLHDATKPRFESHSVVHGVALPELLARAFPAAAKQMDGRLEANLTLSGTGRDWNAIRPTLAGQGRADVRDGVLKDVNVADSVLGGATGVAGLASLVPPDVRGRYPDVFGTGDTRFEALGGSIRIANQRVTTDDCRLAARDYAVTGRGSVDFDGRVDFTATLVASERLTADVGARVKEARYLTDDAGRVAIPFRFVGKMPGVKPVPDPEWLARMVARGVVGKGLDKLLGAKERQPGSKERPERDLLRKGLDGLFGR
jgi:uncharacterized protein involved in outer membrane biogenesis